MKNPAVSLVTTLAGLSLLVLAGCQNMGQLSARHMGRLALSVEWPLSTSAFKLQAIPSETHRIRLSIEGEGLETPRTHTLTRDPSETEDRIQIELPAGLKAVKAEAFDAQERLLAVDVRSVTIIPGQFQRLEMNLQPLGMPTPSPALPLPSSDNNPSSTGPGLLPIPLSPPSTSSPPSTPSTNTSSFAPTPLPVTNPLSNPITPPPSSNTTNTSSTGGSSGGSSSSSTSTVTPVIHSFSPQEGLVGTTVYIEGRYLNKVTSVAFNGVPASFTFETTPTGERIVTSVPLGANTGSISLSTGTTTAASSQFTVLTAVENLSIDEIFPLRDASSGQYIILKNTGTTPVNPSGLTLAYTGKSGMLQSYTIPINTPQIPAAGTLVIHLNQTGSNSGNHVYTGTLYEPLQFIPSQRSEVALCQANPCTSSNMLGYVSFGDTSSSGALASIATAANKWSGPARDIASTQAKILSTNPFPGDNGNGIVLESAPVIFSAGEAVVITDGATQFNYTTTVAADAGPYATSLQINNPPKVTMSSSNNGDGYSTAIQLTSTPPFPNGSQVAIRGQVRHVLAISGNSLNLDQAVMRAIDPGNQGSGRADEIIPFGAPSDPANQTFYVNDRVTYKRFDDYNNPIGGAGVNAQRTVTSSTTTGLKIDSPLSTMSISMTNNGSGGTEPATMSSIPSGLMAGQRWGGLENKSFKVINISGMDVLFDIDFSHCLVRTGNTGNGSSTNPVITDSCLTGSVEIDNGARVKTLDNSTPVYRTIQSLTGTVSTGYQLVFDTPLTNPAAAGDSIKLIPQGGDLELVPSTEFGVFRDVLILTPRSGAIKFVPSGGTVVRRQALKLNSCGSVPDASCYQLTIPSY